MTTLDLDQAEIEFNDIQFGYGDDLVLRPLSQSSKTVSAQIGINLLCVSKDKILLVAIQGGKTMVGQNQRTPTASGSMDWEDLGEVKTFKELGKVAALRELREEWGGNAVRRKSGSCR